MRSRLFVLSAMLVILGCGGYGNNYSTGPGIAPGPPPPPPISDSSFVMVRVTDAGFSPASVTLSLGRAVQWTIAGAQPHIVAAADGSFRSDTLHAGEQFQRSFPAAGSFGVVDELHPALTGTVIVNP